MREMTIIAIAQLLCAHAPINALLLRARLISACGHGVFFGVACVAVSQLVPPERRGAALSMFVGGITIANILGLPGGTAISNAFGWRVTFVVIAALAVLSVIAVFFALPAETHGERQADAPLKLQAQQLLHQEVFMTYLAITIIMIGQLAFGTFQVAMLTRVSGVAEGLVPYYLLAGGAGAVLGIWLGGKGADWNIDATMLIVITGQVISFLALLLAVHDPLWMGVMLFVSSLFGFGFSTPVQLRILQGARAAPRLASTMVSTAYNIGIAAGAALGAILLNAGLSYAMLPLTGIVTSILAGIVAVISIRLPHDS